MRIEVRRKRVAWFDNELKLEYDDSVRAIAEEVEKVMKVKLEKKPQ